MADAHSSPHINWHSEALRGGGRDDFEKGRAELQGHRRALRVKWVRLKLF